MRSILIPSLKFSSLRSASLTPFTSSIHSSRFGNSTSVTKRNNHPFPFISNHSSLSSILSSSILWSSLDFHTCSKSHASNSPLLTFYNYSVRTANGEWFHLKNLRGKVTLVTVCNISNENYRKYLYDLADFKYTMQSKDFEIMVIPKLDSHLNEEVIDKALQNHQSPIQQFLADEAKTSSTLTSSLKLRDIIICRGIPNWFGSSEQNDMQHTSHINYDMDLEVYNNVSSEIGDALNYLCNYAEGSSKTIVEDFEKFVVNRNGRLIFRCGNTYPLEGLRDIIRGELEGRASVTGQEGKRMSGSPSGGGRGGISSINASDQDNIVW